jgi:hypothetical protein
MYNGEWRIYNGEWRMRYFVAIDPPASDSSAAKFFFIKLCGNICKAANCDVPLRRFLQLSPNSICL